MIKHLLKVVVLFLLFNTNNVLAAKLALVIDDFGYRQHNEEQIISFSSKDRKSTRLNSSHRH